MSECPYSQEPIPTPRKPEAGCLSLEEALSFLAEVHTGKQLESSKTSCPDAGGAGGRGGEVTIIQYGGNVHPAG